MVTTKSPPSARACSLTANRACLTCCRFEDVTALTSNAAALTDGASLVRQAAALGLHLSHTTANKFGKSVLAEESGRAAMAAKDYYALLQKLHTRAPPQGHATVAPALPAPAHAVPPPPPCCRT